jgi:hypothetical protein
VNENVFVEDDGDRGRPDHANKKFKLELQFTREEKRALQEAADSEGVEVKELAKDAIMAKVEEASGVEEPDVDPSAPVE